MGDDEGVEGLAEWDRQDKSGQEKMDEEER